jgi:hypothetical protein
MPTIKERPEIRAERLMWIAEAPMEALGEFERLETEMSRALQNEREGWRYADQLEQERIRLAAENAALRADADHMREIFKSCEFADSGYCPRCGGWKVDKWRGCTPKVHTKDCDLRAAIDAARAKGE